MENISYLINEEGERIALQINLHPSKKLSPEEIEDIEDIISYELLKDAPTLDYNSELKKLITKRNSS